MKFYLKAAAAAALFGSLVAPASADNQGLFDSTLKPRHDDVLPVDEHGTLASLFGSEKARDTFFTEHFGSDIVHMKRSESELPAPVAGVDILSLFRSSEITLRTWGSSDVVNKRELPYADFEDYIAKGGSAVAHILGDETFLPLKKHMEEALGMGVSMNVYHSGPNGVALFPHTDRYDVFVLHLEGEKVWEICIPEDMSKGDVGSLSAADIADIKEVAEANVAGCTTHEEESLSTMTCSNMTMVPGDMLYLPKGVVHAATTAPGFDSTTHVTIGLIRDNFKYGDLLASLLHAGHDELMVKLSDDAEADETILALLAAVLDEHVKRDSHGFGLGLRRMMPPWLWRHYEACTSSIKSAECDTEKFDQAKDYFMNSMLAMLDGLKAASHDYIYRMEKKNNADAVEGENNTETKDLLRGKTAWLVELAVESGIDSLRQIDLLHAAMDMHLHRVHAYEAQAMTMTRQERIESMNVAEIKAEADRIMSESAYALIKELSSGKYPEYDRVMEIANAPVMDEAALFEAHRVLSDSAACVTACNIAEAICDAACDLISVGADVCKVACDTVFAVCATPFKLASCDSAPCFSSCDDQPCFSSCDNQILCTSSCDSTCFSSCDGWLGIGSCDGSCIAGCDSGCIGTSCDGSCTLGCDGSCTFGCDDYLSAADPCFSVRDGCYSGCEAAENLANECRDFCETDLNSCSTMCSFVDQSIDAVASGITDFFTEALDFIKNLVNEIADAVNNAISVLESIATTVYDAYQQVDSGLSTINVDTSINLSEGVITDILDVFINLVSLQLAPYCSLMAFMSWVGLAGMTAGFGLQLGLNTYSMSMSLVSEDANIFSDKALILEACLGYVIAVPDADLSFAIGYGITFGTGDQANLSYEDNGMWGSDVATPSVQLGQQISISTNFLTYFGFPVVLGGGVGWNLLNGNSYVNPFSTAPNAAGFAVEIDTGAFDPDGLISIEYAVCASLGRVAPSLASRKLEEDGVVTVLGKEYTDAGELRYEMENLGRRKMQRLLQGNRNGNGNANGNGGGNGNANGNGNGVGNGGRDGINNIKNNRGNKKGPRPSSNKPEKAKDHVVGKGPFDRTVSDEPDHIATPEELDRDHYQRFVDEYNRNFRSLFDDKPLSQVVAELDAERLEILYERIGGSPDTISLPVENADA